MQPDYVYHALNRGVARLALFEKDGDYEAFERVLLEAWQRQPIRILGYCLMPNHWHFVLASLRESRRAVRFGAMAVEHVEASRTACILGTV